MNYFYNYYNPIQEEIFTFMFKDGVSGGTSLPSYVLTISINV